LGKRTKWAHIQQISTRDEENRSAGGVIFTRRGNAGALRERDLGESQEVGKKGNYLSDPKPVFPLDEFSLCVFMGSRAEEDKVTLALCVYHIDGREPRTGEPKMKFHRRK